MGEGLSVIGGVVSHMLGLRQATRQDQLAADLARQAERNQRAATERTVDAASEFDPAHPPRRGSIVDVIA